MVIMRNADYFVETFLKNVLRVSDEALLSLPYYYINERVNINNKISLMS